MSITTQELDLLLRYLAAKESWERLVSACAQTPQSAELHAERDKAEAKYDALKAEGGEGQPGDAPCCLRYGHLHHPAFSLRTCRWHGIGLGDGSIVYRLEGTPFYLGITPARPSFKVYEEGAGARGNALLRGRKGSLSAALKLAAGLVPSTPADIMARVKETTPCDHEKLDRMAYLAEPGRRLWVLSAYGHDGYTGLGEAATATGLHASMLEAMFGSPSSVWCVAFTTDSGRKGQLHPIVLSTVEEARERWWILSHDGHNLVSGGHASRASMERLARDYPGSMVYQGCMFIREDGSVFTTIVSLADHLDGV
jgi:hypothetical protein